MWKAVQIEVDQSSENEFGGEWGGARRSLGCEAKPVRVPQTINRAEGSVIFLSCRVLRVIGRGNLMINKIVSCSPVSLSSGGPK